MCKMEDVASLDHDDNHDQDQDQDQDGHTNWATHAPPLLLLPFFFFLLPLSPPSVSSLSRRSPWVKEDAFSVVNYLRETRAKREWRNWGPLRTSWRLHAYGNLIWCDAFPAYT